MSRRLVLASASPARRRLLENAGFAPEVIVSGLDEDAVEAATAQELVLALAQGKAESVAARLREDPGPAAVVIGCDSMLGFQGEVVGKPVTAGVARDRWRRLRGNTGVLLTGHAVIDTASGAASAGVASTSVRFGCPTDEEIDAYVATGEPLHVAGAFTLDGRSAPFIDGVDGDPSNVIGLSLPLFRTLLDRIGVRLTELWA